jgi:glycosyltransferase involved in cell wall biosynthesis
MPGTLLPVESLNPLGASPPQLLFVGNFIHAPNVDAATRLIGQIFPAVRKHYPEAKLLIVGDHPTVQLQQMAGDNVVITGCVPDVTTYLDDAAVVVVPLRLGGGIRVKVLEAMASGKAVLASPLAVEGLDLSPGEHVMVAETDEQFSAGIIELLSNPPSRSALASRARTWAEENLGWQNAVTAYDKLYQSLIDGQSIQT